jgi:hypothetical protein
MSGQILKKGTWRAGLEEILRIDGPIDRPTGWERGYHVVGISFEPVSAPGPATEEATQSGDLASRAAALAVEAPHVAAPAPPVPRLSGNLAEDVHAVAGLTWAQMADVFKISERAAAGWRTQGVPGLRRETMEALRAIGVILVGGLGPAGVAEWLTAGSPSRLQRLRAGEVAAVAEEAQSYRDTPAF